MEGTQKFTIGDQLVDKITEWSFKKQTRQVERILMSYVKVAKLVLEK